MENDSKASLSQLLEKYASDHTTVESGLLTRLRRETHLRTHMPQMLCDHLQGSLLRMMSRMISPKKVLEIGTFTGYSAICLAEGLVKEGTLDTIEINPELKDFASRYFQEAGIYNKIILHTGDALDILPLLEGPYDLVYLDADKEHYCRYFDLVISMVSPGGWIIADNALWYGRVIEDNNSSDKETAGIKAFNDYVHSHSSIENLLLPIRDGLMVMRKIG